MDTEGLDKWCRGAADPLVCKGPAVIPTRASNVQREETVRMDGVRVP